MKSLALILSMLIAGAAVGLVVWYYAILAGVRKFRGRDEDV